MDRQPIHQIRSCKIYPTSYTLSMGVPNRGWNSVATSGTRLCSSFDSWFSLSSSVSLSFVFVFSYPAHLFGIHTFFQTLFLLLYSFFSLNPVTSFVFRTVELVFVLAVQLWISYAFFTSQLERSSSSGENTAATTTIPKKSKDKTTPTSSPRGKNSSNKRKDKWQL